MLVVLVERRDNVKLPLPLPRTCPSQVLGFEASLLQVLESLCVGLH